jgi:hypothetical protein
MLRGVQHAVPTDPSLLHNNLSEISKIVVAKNKSYYAITTDPLVLHAAVLLTFLYT